ncbi:flagellar basal body-associated protein FliL [Rhodosalinus sp. K401]|uniref:flagellar basal body-associated FliL family protein n=1 Tax=Rhodosalinus sp. K401 TaxID=3239195 RepID=UPI00352454E2
MTEDSETQDSPSGRGKLPLLLGVALALAGAGAGFFAVREGLIPLPSDEGGAPRSESMADLAFVPLDPVVIALDSGSRRQHLRFRAELEVPPPHQKEVESLRPRVVDALHSYLRALDPAEIEAPGALERLRAQMLRRVQIITGGDRVADLLVMEFVLN